jgi:hypothetical protein
MKKRFAQQDFFLWNWRQIALCVIAATIPLTVGLGNIALITGFLLALVLAVKTKVKLIRDARVAFIFPLLFFAWITVSALFSNDLSAGLKQVDKALLYPLIAIIFLVYRQKSGISIKKVLIVFSILTCAVDLIYIISGINSVLAGREYHKIIFHGFSEIFDQHAVYVALYSAFSIFILTKYFIIEKVKPSFRIAALGAILILMLGLVFTASKAVIVIFSCLYLVQILIGKPQPMWRISILGILTGTLLIVSQVPEISDRFKEGLEFDLGQFEPTNDLTNAKAFSNKEKEEISDLELRYIMLKIGLYHVIDDQAYLLGYGQGDVQHYLDYYYMYYGLAPNWFEGYNLHNQYLQIFASLGVLALLIFLYYIGYSLMKAIRGGDSLHLLFLLSVIFVFIFECLLSRNKGIVFFFFFNTMFLFNYSTIENRTSRDPGNP